MLIVEVGGTVGDIESLPFLEAIRQFRADVGRENVCYIHIALVPYIATAGELKTKPVQHSVKELRAVGISPDVILCRTDRFLLARGEGEDRALLQRGRRRGDHRQGRRVHLRGAAAPPRRGRRREDHAAAQHLDRPPEPRRSGSVWSRRVKNPERDVHDRDGRQVRRPHRVVQEPQRGAAPRRHRAQGARRRSSTSTRRSSTIPAALADVDGILVPHGFGSRGVEGKIVAVRYAREQPHAVLRHLLRHADRGDRVRAPRRGPRAAPTRREVDPETPHPVIDLLPEQRAVDDKGATMRLGAYPCVLTPGHAGVRGLRHAQITERHRHRYEFNPEYRDQLEQARPRALRHLAGRPARRDGRARGPPVVRRLPVPPRVPVDGPSRRTRSSTPSCGGGRAAAGARRASRRRPLARGLRWRRAAVACESPRLRLETAVVGSVSSVGRAPCSHRGGHWFEPSTSHHRPVLAQ